MQSVGFKTLFHFVRIECCVVNVNLYFKSYCEELSEVKHGHKDYPCKPELSVEFGCLCELCSKQDKQSPSFCRTNLPVMQVAC